MVRLVPAEVPRAGGTARVCHRLGQCFGDDLCKVTHFVDVQLEEQPREGTALPLMCQASLLPARGRNVNRPIALGKASATQSGRTSLAIATLRR